MHMYPIYMCKVCLQQCVNASYLLIDLYIWSWVSCRQPSFVIFLFLKNQTCRDKSLQSEIPLFANNGVGRDAC